MSVMYIVAAVWLGIGMWLGFKRGVIAVLGALLGLVLSYAGFIFLGPLVVEYIAPHISAQWQWPATGLLIFVAVSILVKLVFWPLVALTRKSFASRVLGAVLNGAVTVVFITFAIWGIGFLQALPNNPAATAILKQIDYHPDSLLVQYANSWVGKLIATGAEVAGIAPTKATAIADFAKAPSETLNTAKEAGNAPATQALFKSTDAMTAIKEGDADALVATPAFENFAAEPAVSKLL